MWQGAFDFEVIPRLDLLHSSEQSSDQLDAIVGKMREAGDGPFFDFAVLSIRLREQIRNAFSVPPQPSGRHFIGPRSYICRAAFAVPAGARPQTKKLAA